MNAIDNIEQMLSTYRERNAIYGDNYKVAGVIFKQLFKDGLEIKTIEDYNRFAILMQIINKIIRYSFNWQTGHCDSLHDLAVYSAILMELDQEYINDVK